METADFQAALQEKAAFAEEVLKRYLPKEQGYQKTVLEAMNDAVLAGGKRLRPIMMYETYRMFGGTDQVIEPFMAAIEMIHTYSLVHDDLPAMDNDEYRRGRKTTWFAYGEAMGILAGDALLNYAFETAFSAFSAQGAQDTDEQAGKRLCAIGEALKILSKKAGIYGMIGGQTADIEAEGQETLTKEQLLFIHEHKTAALIQAAMMVGAVLAGAGEQETALIEKCAYNIGIAFQIQDDILDVIGDSAELGKPVGSDARSNKQTYVTLNGLEKSKEDVARLSEEAVQILRQFPGDHAFLEQLTEYLVNRRS